MIKALVVIEGNAEINQELDLDGLLKQVRNCKVTAYLTQNGSEGPSHFHISNHIVIFCNYILTAQCCYQDSKESFLLVHYAITFKDLQNYIQYIYTVVQTLDNFRISILKHSRNQDNRILHILRQALSAFHMKYKQEAEAVST